jgi:hypothetical protein
MYGKIEYDDIGKPKCEICGKHFDRVISHVRQKHGLSEKEYKKKFGFDLKKGICSFSSSQLSREKVFENYDKAIKQNLLEGGSKSRYKKGTKGRTKEMVSEQTRILLKERLNEPKMKEVLKQLGTKLGKSGLGNLKRWGTKNDS